MTAPRLSAAGLLTRTLLGTLIFALALAMSGIVADTAQRAGAPIALVRGVAAAVVLVVTVALLALLLRRDRRRLRDLLARPAQALVGLVVVAASTLLVFGSAVLAGDVTFRSMDGSALARFLVLNTLTALALEAFPEELVFRGYVYGTARRRLRPGPAGLISTGVFVSAVGVSDLIQLGLARLIGQRSPDLSLAPNGQDPVSYLILLTVFSIMLITLREITGSIWSTMAAHLTFLTVNRIVFSSTQFDTGVSLQRAPGTELLVLANLGLAIVLALLLNRLGLIRRPERPDRDPAHVSATHAS